MKIVMATKNEGKVEELKEILKGLDIITMSEAGIDIEIVEDGTSFEENAIKKAKEVFLACGCPSLADDSGLEVEALGGAPGIFSARYAGENASDSEKMEKLLLELNGNENRKARFVCVIALAMTQDNIIVARGECEGEIALKPKGNNGFGYDPIFFLPQFGLTFAEISQQQKNTISHRRRAIEMLYNKIDLAN